MDRNNQCLMPSIFEFWGKKSQKRREKKKEVSKASNLNRGVRSGDRREACWGEDAPRWWWHCWGPPRLASHTASPTRHRPRPSWASASSVMGHAWAPPLYKDPADRLCHERTSGDPATPHGAERPHRGEHRSSRWLRRRPCRQELEVVGGFGSLGRHETGCRDPPVHPSLLRRGQRLSGTEWEAHFLSCASNEFCEIFEIRSHWFSLPSWRKFQKNPAIGRGPSVLCVGSWWLLNS